MKIKETVNYFVNKTIQLLDSKDATSTELELLNLKLNVVYNEIVHIISSIDTYILEEMYNVKETYGELIAYCDTLVDVMNKLKIESENNNE